MQTKCQMTTDFGEHFFTAWLVFSVIIRIPAFPCHSGHEVIDPLLLRACFVVALV